MNSRILIAIALLALAGALVFAARPHEATADERIDQITTELRCPVCQGLSVKDSTSETSRQMRDLVAQRVAEGRTDDEIQGEFRASYGDWVLLSPPTSSWTGLIWLVPLAALAAGVTVAVSRMRPVRPSDAAPTARELAALRERVVREETLDLPTADGAG